MDVIICVNHAKMDGTNIVVNATIFNDALNGFRFSCDGDGWVYTTRCGDTNKTHDVFFIELKQSCPHKVVCHMMIDNEWTYCGHIIATTQTNTLYDSDGVQESHTYTRPNTELFELQCEVV